MKGKPATADKSVLPPAIIFCGRKYWKCPIVFCSVAGMLYFWNQIEKAGAEHFLSSTRYIRRHLTTETGNSKNDGISAQSTCYAYSVELCLYRFVIRYASTS